MYTYRWFTPLYNRTNTALQNNHIPIKNFKGVIHTWALLGQIDKQTTTRKKIIAVSGACHKIISQ